MPEAVRVLSHPTGHETYNDGLKEGRRRALAEALEHLKTTGDLYRWLEEQTKEIET